MSRLPTDHDNALSKALAAARDAARLRLQRGAECLAATMPADGVLFSALWRRVGHAPVRVTLLWPGWLLEADPDSGEIIAETDAADMHAHRPEAAAFVVRRALGKPLRQVNYQPPQAERLRVSIDACCVVRIHSLKTHELLAESEPGQPRVLRADFVPLTPADLAPRFT